MNLSELAEPFPAEDIEWRISRSGMGQKGIFALVIPYITARAIQKRLDDVCGVANWRNEEPRMVDVNGKSAFVGGIAIRIDSEVARITHGHDRATIVCEWVTKWDVCEPTNIEAAKGGFSGAMKRAGAQWGIGRYLYYLDEVFAEVSEQQNSGSQWHYARLAEKHGGAVYYWKTPGLPAWALPKDPEHEVTQSHLDEVKQAWRAKFASDVKNPGELREGFSRFVTSVVGEFPSADYTCWTRDAFEKCRERIANTTEPNGVSADVPFE